MAREKRSEKVPGLPGYYTLRQAKLLKSLPLSKTVTEATLKSGYSEKNAAQSGYQALQAVRGRVPDLMTRLGLSEEVLIQKHLVKNLERKKTVFVREEKIEKRTTGRGKQKRVEEVVRHIVKKHVLEDNQIQFRAMQEGFLLHGSYAPRDPKEAAQFGVKVIIQNVRGTPRPPIDIKPGMAIPELEVEVVAKNGNKKNGAKP